MVVGFLWVFGFLGGFLFVFLFVCFFNTVRSIQLDDTISEVS